MASTAPNNRKDLFTPILGITNIVGIIVPNTDPNMLNKYKFPITFPVSSKEVILIFASSGEIVPIKINGTLNNTMLQIIEDIIIIFPNCTSEANIIDPIITILDVSGTVHMNKKDINKFLTILSSQVLVFTNLSACLPPK